MDNTRIKEIDRTLFREIKNAVSGTEVIREVVLPYTNQFLRLLIKSMAAGCENWEEKYIYEKDIEYIENKEYAKSILRSKYYVRDSQDNLKVRAQYKDIIGEMDLAARLKLIQFRLLDERSIHNEEAAQGIREFLKYVRILRNKAAHETETDNYAADERIIELKNVTEEAKKHFGSILVNKEKCIKHFDNLLAYYEKVLNMLHFCSTPGIDTEDPCREYTMEYLYSYDKVIFSFPCCNNRLMENWIADYIKVCEKKLLLDDGTLYYLEQSSKWRNEKKRERAKSLLMLLNGHRNFVGSCEIPNLDPDNIIDEQDGINNLISALNNTEEKICIVTDNEYFLSKQDKISHNIVIVMPVRCSNSRFGDNVCVVLGTPDSPFFVEEKMSIEDEALESKMDLFDEADSDYTEAGDQPSPSILDQKGSTAEFDKSLNTLKVYPGENSRIYYGKPEDDNRLLLNSEIGSGGEGRIYSTDIAECVKIYHRDRLKAEKIQKLRKMIRIKNKIPDNICWPREIIYESMKKIPVGYSMTNIENCNVVTVEKVVKLLCQRTGYKDFDGYTRSTLVSICQDIAYKIAKLHELNILVGDINYRNIMVDRKGKVWFIDTDSYQIGSYLCDVGMPEFTSPGVWKRGFDSRRNKEDDDFGLAVLIYYILFLGDYPFKTEGSYSAANTIKQAIVSGNYKWKNKSVLSNSYADYIYRNLTEDVKQNFLRAFTAGEKCPTAREWVAAMDRMLSAIDQGKGIEYDPQRNKKGISNEIFPADAIELAGDIWDEKQCSKCGSGFKYVKHKDRSCGTEDLCISCREQRSIERGLIFRLKCRNCKNTFTVNQWDYINKISNTENAVCPDCDKRIVIPDEKDYALNTKGKMEILLRSIAEKIEKLEI